MARIDTNKEQIISEGGIYLNDYLQQDLQNTESELFVLNGDLYKIIAGNLRKSKQAVMEFLHDRKPDLPIDIHDLLYEQNHFLGYSMEFYQEHTTLYEILKQDISLQERKTIALALIQLYEKMFQLHIIYYDWHSKNLLFHDDFKLLDVDSGKITQDTIYDAKARRYLLMLCLSVLLGKDFDFDYHFSCVEVFEKLVDKEEAALSQFIPMDFDFMRQEITDYTSEKVCYKRELIMQK